MKGLLLKDLYMVKSYCKSYLFIAAIFIAISFVGNDNLFVVLYPILFCGMIPVNLLGYDERSRWLQYSSTLPYTKAQIVSSKYLIGLFAQTAMLIVIGIAQIIRMSINGDVQVNNFLALMPTVLIVSTVTPSFALPFIFKLGVEKGRIAYYVVIGVAVAVSLIATNLFEEGFQAEIGQNMILALLCLVGIGIYILSWCLSIVFYKKREL